MMAANRFVIFLIILKINAVVPLASLDAFAARLPTVFVAEPSILDTALHSDEPDYSNERVTLFRERNGWCPYSERGELQRECQWCPPKQLISQLILSFVLPQCGSRLR